MERLKAESGAGETKGEAVTLQKEMQEKDNVIEELKQNLLEMTEKHEKMTAESELQFNNKIALLEKQLEELRQVRLSNNKIALIHCIWNNFALPKCDGS